MEKTIGNHHLGVGPARPVQILKGVNMSYRKSALGDLRPDVRLRGKGAQVGNDMQLSLQLAAKGFTLIYDPAVLVDHFPGMRPIEEDRAYFNPGSHYDEIYNKTLILLGYLKTQPSGWLRQMVFVLSMALMGTRKAPGLLMLAVDLVDAISEWMGTLSDKSRGLLRCDSRVSLTFASKQKEPCCLHGSAANQNQWRRCG